MKWEIKMKTKRQYTPTRKLKLKDWLSQVHIEQWEPPYTSWGSIDWYNYLGKHFGSITKAECHVIRQFHSRHTYIWASKDMSKDVEHSGTNCKSPKLETAQTSTNSRMKWIYTIEYSSLPLICLSAFSGISYPWSTTV